MFLLFDEKILGSCQIVAGIIDEKLIAALLWHAIRQQIRLRNIHTQRVHFGFFCQAIYPSRESIAAIK
jgi:hypothetical protein